MFFALWPERALQVALADATRDVVLASGGRPVLPEIFHITLAFLGSVLEARLAEVMAIGSAVAAEVEPLAIQVGLQTLEYWKKPGVLCATAPVSATGNQSGDPSNESFGAAGALAGKLKSKLSGAGFTPDLKAFRSHVTLARKVAALPTCAGGVRFAAWSFTDFALVESRTDAQGPVYRVLESYPWALAQ